MFSHSFTQHTKISRYVQRPIIYVQFMLANTKLTKVIKNNLSLIELQMF